MRELRRLAAVLCLGIVTSTAAMAQIVVGQTTGLTGPAAAGSNENMVGARLWFDRVNATGGIGGKRIELVTLDDRFEPARAAENALRLIMVRQVMALFMTRGTPHTEALRHMLAQYEVPLVAPSTGAMLLHKPVDPWIFNVRAPYQREAEKLVQHLATIGMRRIGLVHVADSFGEDGAAGALRGFENTKIKPLFVESYDRAKPVFTSVVQKAKAGDAQAVVFIGTADAVVEGTQALRAAGSLAQIGTLSNNASSGFIKALGEHANGTIVTQVFPSERALSTTLVREANELARAAGIAELTPAMIEGFAGAKVLVEGLRRAGPNPTRQTLRQALEGLRNVDIGGLELSYGPNDHSGLNFTELSIISGGYYRR